MCDVVYVLHVESLERNVTAAQHVAAVFKAAGAEDVDIPTLDAERFRFDQALTAEPAPESGGAALLRQLGVA